MDRLEGGGTASFEAIVEALIEVIGHADRAEPLQDYCLGLMMPVARKSVEPLAAVTAPARVSAKHQSLLHFVGHSPWSDEALIAKVRDHVLPQMIERGGAIRAWIVDDTGFPKRGRHSVGVARQYCGQLGKQDNYQVAVSLSIANETASLPFAGGSICRSLGRKMWRFVGRRRCPTASSSRRSRRSRSTRSAVSSRRERRPA